MTLPPFYAVPLLLTERGGRVGRVQASRVEGLALDNLTNQTLIRSLPAALLG